MYRLGAGAATIASAGAAVGIGNVLSSSIHSVARNPSLAKQSFGYAILGFALTEAIASFAPMMAFLISSVFRSKKESFSFIITTIFLKQIVYSAHSMNSQFELSSWQDLSSNYSQR